MDSNIIIFSSKLSVGVAVHKTVSNSHSKCKQGEPVNVCLVETLSQMAYVAEMLPKFYYSLSFIFACGLPLLIGYNFIKL